MQQFGGHGYYLLPQHQRRSKMAQVKNVQCEYPGCGKQFFHRKNLRRHVKEKHPDCCEADSSSSTTTMPMQEWIDHIDQQLIDTNNQVVTAAQEGDAIIIDRNDEVGTNKGDAILLDGDDDDEETAEDKQENVTIEAKEHDNDDIDEKKEKGYEETTAPST